MNLEQLLRVAATAIVWVIVSVLMGIFTLINFFWGVPAIISWLLIGLGIIGTIFLWNEETWQAFRQSALKEIEAGIRNELQNLSDKDLAEAKGGIQEVKQKFGINIDLPLGTGKKKKRDLNSILETFSDEELVEVKLKLSSGEMNEDELFDWLQDSQKCGKSRKLKHG